LIAAPARWFGFNFSSATTSGRALTPVFRVAAAVRDNPPEKALPLAKELANTLAMTKTVNVVEFKDRFSELLAWVEQGGEVIVCWRNEPLARVEPARKSAPRRRNAAS
jgi:prevent-host-death family protein